MRIVSLFGGAAVAGYTVAIRIVIFFILPAWGLSNAAATLVGQNLGAAGRIGPSRRSGAPVFYNLIFLGTLGVFFIVFATPIVRLFVQDPAVVPIAATALRTFSCGNMGYAYVMVILQAFNGAGDTFTSDDRELLSASGCWKFPWRGRWRRRHIWGPRGRF